MSAKEKPISLEVSSRQSRVGQPTMPPILFEGRRYQQIVNGEREGLRQRTGLMSIVDLQGNTRSVVKIYDVPREPGLEGDAGDVFFTKFELDAGRRQIVVGNERGQVFFYRIDDGTVQPRK
jgi:hypothetical protein